MEPGEGSAAPKATVALPGTDVNLAGRAPARLAVHCSLATGGPGAATPHAPFGRPRRPLGTFPRGESTSSARRRTKPPTRNRFLVDGKGKPYLAFPVTQRVSPLRRRPKRFPIALWKPSAPYLLKLFQAKKPKVFSSFLSMKKRVFYSPLHHQPSRWFSFRNKSAPRTISCKERLFLTSHH